MKISTKGRYGLRIMTDLAVYGSDCCVSLKDIAEREHLSEKYLEQIINLLSKEGLVKSVRGDKNNTLSSFCAKKLKTRRTLLYPKKLSFSSHLEILMIFSGDLFDSFIIVGILSSPTGISAVKNIICVDTVSSTESLSAPPI